jgi:selenocysteine lyase/cysteine desulfurase
MLMINIVPALHEIPSPTGPAYRPSARDLAFTELEASVRLALETYSNVHRGTGHFSLLTTRLYEQAREVVLESLGLPKDRFTVIFCTPERASVLNSHFETECCLTLSSRDLGLPLGLTALAVEKKALPEGPPPQTGGGTAKMVSRASVVWEDSPDRFEAGTPAAINAIALARALQISRRAGPDVFKTSEPPTAAASQILLRDEFESYTGRRLLLHLRRSMIGRGIKVPTAEGFRPFINLDNGASTPAFSPVWKAVCRTWRLPEEVRPSLIAQAREMCARFFNAPSDEYDLIFTANTTEALNLVAEGLALESTAHTEPVVLNTLLEHNSNELPWRYKDGLSSVRMPIDDDGFVDLAELERVLREHNRDHAHGKKRIRIVAVTGASNVLGTCLDLKEIGRIAHRHQARLLVDAAQLSGHRKIDVAADGLDVLAFSGHKMYAPFGSGGLIVRKGLLKFGEDRTKRIKASGEENAMGIAALGKAVDLLGRIGMEVVQEEEEKLTRRALESLAAVPNIVIFGVQDPASPQFHQKGGVISFSLKHVPHNIVAEELAEKGAIGVRNGCFCAHLLVKRLLRIHPVREALANFGLKLLPALTKSLLPGLVRVSFGLENDEREVDHLIKILEKIGARRRSIADRILAWAHNATPRVPSTEAGKHMQKWVRAAAARVYPTNRTVAPPFERPRCCRSIN